MNEIDIDTLTGPAAPVEHCGRLMRWLGSTTSWEGDEGKGFELTASGWSCDCGARVSVIVRVPA